MPELTFHIEQVSAAPRAVAPTLSFRLRIDAGESQQQIHSILLRCQIQIEAARRRYQESDQQGLFDLFGDPQDWGRTVRNLLWTEVSTSIPAFTGSIRIDLPVVCTYDFNVAATKYFDALEDGEVPLCLLFSGTVFYAGDHGPLQVGKIPWETEAQFRMPVRVWRTMMDAYYPDCVWLPLPRKIFNSLRELQRRTRSTTIEGALEALLHSPQSVEAQSP